MLLLSKKHREYDSASNDAAACRGFARRDQRTTEAATGGEVAATRVCAVEDALPLYRQSVILKRDTGVDIGRSTMDGWVMQVGELLMPIVRVMQRELLAGSYIQADETPVDVQMRDGRGKSHQAYLWQYGSPGGGVVFDFRMGRAREGPKQFPGPFNGILQTDGYAAYDHISGPKMIHACCLAHARRKFVDAIKINKQNADSLRIVTWMDALFAIDAQAREANMDHAARHALRLHCSTKCGITSLK